MVASLAEAQSPNVPPETFLLHYRQIRDATRAHEDAGMALARTRKAAKGAGLDLDALRLLERLAKLEDDEAELQLRHVRQYATWAGLPLGTQLDAFGAHQIVAPKPKAVDDHAIWRASDAGHVAGRAGQPRESNPHAPGSELHTSWDSGWLNGQRAIAASMAIEGDPDEAEAEKPAPRGRGRPPARRRRRTNGATELPY